MAATDQPYRNQKTLNIVFALSCVAMFLSVIWMLVDDYNKPFKAIQRDFRDVEETLGLATMVDNLPDPDDLEVARKEVARRRQELADERARLADTNKEILTERDKAYSQVQDIKANLDAQKSYRDIDVEHVGQTPNNSK